MLSHCVRLFYRACYTLQLQRGVACEVFAGTFESAVSRVGGLSEVAEVAAQRELCTGWERGTETLTEHYHG